MVTTHHHSLYKILAVKIPSTDKKGTFELASLCFWGHCITSFISSLLLWVGGGCICFLFFFKVHLLCFQDSMDSLHRRLERSKQMQTVLRAFEARDRNLLEDNLWRVSFWSCASVLVMLCVALTQVRVAQTHHTMICGVWSNLQGRKN